LTTSFNHTSAQAGVNGAQKDSFDGDISPVDYAKFSAFLEEESGITLGENKGYLIRSRLSAIMQDCAVRTVGELVDKLERTGSQRLRIRVIDAMTTNETLWFRDGKPFAFLENIVLPHFAAQGLSRPLKAWSAACSSGQEPYSIAITFREYQTKNPGRLPHGIDILATDISPSMLEYARAGEYDGLGIVRGLNPERQQLYFQKDGNRLNIKPDITKYVRFRELNLLGDYSLLGDFDVVFLRNVLIYFSHENKKQILQRARRRINAGGYLFLGGSEPMGNYSDEFEMVHSPYGVAYRVRPTS
jgi:chemotaxis protein methyltransferase CheR